MPTSDELWSWIYSPLRELTGERAANPDSSWDDLRSSFLERAGLLEPSQHPLVDELIRTLDELPPDDRNALLDDGGKVQVDGLLQADGNLTVDGNATLTVDQGNLTAAEALFIQLL